MLPHIKHKISGIRFLLWSRGDENVGVSNVGRLAIDYDLNDILNTLIKPIIKHVAMLGYVLELKQSPREKHSKVDWEQLKNTMDVPSGVPKDISPLGMALLAVCIKYYNKPTRKVHTKDITKQIIRDYPEVAKFYDFDTRRISYATIFTADNGRGGGLVPKGLLKMDKDSENNRRYWVNHS